MNQGQLCSQYKNISVQDNGVTVLISLGFENLFLLYFRFTLFSKIDIQTSQVKEQLRFKQLNNHAIKRKFEVKYKNVKLHYCNSFTGKCKNKIKIVCGI